MPSPSAPDKRREIEARLLAALSDSIEPVQAGWMYRLSLTATALAMLTLPALYVGLIALILHTIWWYWRQLGQGGSPVSFAFVAGLGLTVIAFLVKPFFARPVNDARPQRLKPSAEPFLFAYVSELCRAVGAPAPTSIRVMCDVNAGARFRRGWLSLFTGELSLMIGLPLAAGMSVRQLTGILAHEFGHFSQGGGMRAHYVISSLNRWFARAAYERDHWDVLLANAADWSPRQIKGIFWAAQFLVWLSRQFLAAMTWVGHAISCYMSRQMEFDADLREVRVVGVRTFSSSCSRLRDLNLARLLIDSQLDRFYTEGRLPDDLPAMVAGSVAQVPKELRSHVRAFEREQETGWFDTHPTNVDRIAHAKAAGDEGIMNLERDLPATVLFQNFERVCQAATVDFYAAALDKKFRKSLLTPTSGLVAQREDELAAGKALDRYFQVHIPIFRPLLLPPESEQPAEDGQALAVQLVADRKRMLELVDGYETLVKRYDQAEAALLLASQAEIIVRCKLRIQAAEFKLRSGRAKDVTEYVRRAREGVETLAAKMLEFEEVATDRLTAALRLLHVRSMQSRVPDGPQLFRQIQDLLPSARVVSELLTELAPARFTYRRIFALFSRLDARQPPPQLIEAIQDQLEKLHGRLSALQDRMGGEEYPLEHKKAELTLVQYALPKIPEAMDVAGLIAVTENAAERLMGLQVRLIAKLAHAAEMVEAALGLPRLSARSTEEPAERPQRKSRSTSPR